MKTMFNHVGQQFEVLSRRERVLIGIALLALVSIIGFMPLESLWKKQTSISQQLKALEQENQISVQQIELYQQRLTMDPNQDYQQRLVLLQQQNQEIDMQLNEQMVDMVPADYMPELLGNLLGQVQGIKLIKFTSIAPVPLLAVGDEKKLNLYSHGIRMSLEGDYFSVMRFVEAVEAMPDKLYWKRLDYKVAEYPKGMIDIEVYTLSLNKDFISVAK
ncbi:MSHA biogenesis protein MshJ [Shewanella sp. JNE10-2]|uniref:MSHA biogenesis protein MshJ n=1 Tax=unclassified Shewanella TaxID=196818 RepID=UPI0020045E7F|nr:MULTISPECIES: MSHA biogenesis protein MshJ [unclassified Shewanella]MCK7630852.1 MSHA biogenesis protein MshJ [Shewanella sp. JNE9-1]MCK7635450.1 MSHA biogenesis protein MshJ [Shewanella sp. JNE17]MCK7646105.1 MSHA biogenesis protein MshJ [Shewanella sp. JNE3-1]MCK7650676.1 MSHA biogenesis protein MshJ [Shewanella sp. JNE8]MCK7653636.1 MSHA biogenesis protein MshJ [Shewanella sp. JNE4-1]